jgi:hypothetical protein
LRNHYFWLLMCSLVERAGGSAITTRQALIAGTFWCGMGLRSIVALFPRLFAPGDPARILPCSSSARSASNRSAEAEQIGQGEQSANGASNQQRLCFRPPLS